MESRDADNSAIGSGKLLKHNRKWFNYYIHNNEGDKVSWYLVYFFISVLFLTQFVSFYYLYAYYLNLDNKYEIKFKELRIKMNSHDVVLQRAKRDLGIKENSIMKPAIDEIKVDVKDAEGAKNDSTLTIEEVIHFKQNFSAEDWVWLNKYSRVPLKIMEEFCKTTHDKCPPQKGDPGEKGDQGEKGDRGDKGRDGSPGQMGLTGPRGPIGPPGMKGEKGDKGNAGLDGRPSVPGEPGLDGIPGRNGKDGIPGKKGDPGRDGRDGFDGKDGTPGEKGEKGDQGLKGEKGAPGLPGPRGKVGKAGVDGIPGQPGISAKNCSVNGTNQLLIPPTIVGSEPALYIKNKTVNENDNLRIKCSSTGVPQPINTWRRILDGEQITIHQGQWKEIDSSSESIYFKNISREHMGEYTCIAENGIPPPANHTFYLYVHFPPYIEIHNVILNVTLNSTALLECKIEAFPRGVYYWETAQGKLLEQSTDRFLVDYKHNGLYETELTLNITDVQKEDLGIYYCIGKNVKGITQGYINVTDNPRRELPIVTEVCNKQRITFFGLPPPPPDGTLCPECSPCKICGFGYRDLDIRTLTNKSSSALIRTRNCEMETIGKPVYHNSLLDTYGSWMRDSFSEIGDFYYVTSEHNSTSLFQYNNKSAFINKSHSKVYKLNEPIVGNDHIVYNRSFYYFTNRQNATIINYNLESDETVASLELQYCDTSPGNHLYKSEYNSVDIMADDNGIWIVCAVTNSNNTAVTKVNITSFKIEYAWNITVKHQDVGDMFIICGILYAVDSVTEFNTKISLALDLYRNKLLDEVTIQFTNPFKNTTMITYNNRLKELYTWDNGNMLTYPIKCHELNSDTSSGSNETLSETPTTLSETQMKKN